jgi:hypothetical protein
VPSYKVLSYGELHYLCTACLIIVTCTLVDGAQIFEEEIGGVKGHFGPINALAFNPDGRRCARLNFFLNTLSCILGKNPHCNL